MAIRPSPVLVNQLSQSNILAIKYRFISSISCDSKKLLAEEEPSVDVCIIDSQHVKGVDSVEHDASNSIRKYTQRITQFGEGPHGKLLWNLRRTSATEFVINGRNRYLYDQIRTMSQKVFPKCPPIVKPQPPPKEEYTIIKLEMKKPSKKLPVMPAGTCECQPPEPLKDVKPLARLKPICIKEKPKVCPRPHTCADNPRADNELKVCEKKLPYLESIKCPCVNPEPIKDVKPLKRLAKPCIKEPPKICKPPPKCDAPRADANLKVTPKEFKPIVPGKCVCIEEKLCPGKPLPKLEPRPVKEPPKCVMPCVGIECCPPRADESLKVASKTLPALERNPCPCVEPYIPPKMPHLKRLPKDCTVQTRVCPVFVTCDTPRADKDYKVRPKTLRELVPGYCECIVEKLRDAPPLPKLCPKPVKEPPKCKKPCEGIECCPPRADEGLQIRPKTLPPMDRDDCPCVNPEPLKSIKLPRLPKKEVPDRPKVCPVPEVCPNIKPVVLRKQLPCLPVSCCPCVEPEIPQCLPKMRRLPPCPMPDPPKICPREIPLCELDTPRADRDDWSYMIKKSSSSSSSSGCDSSGVNRTQKRDYSFIAPNKFLSEGMILCAIGVQPAFPSAFINRTRAVNALDCDMPSFAYEPLLTNVTSRSNTSNSTSDASTPTAAHMLQRVKLLNLAVDKFVQLSTLSKEMVILPIISLVHQLSYVGNAMRSFRMWYETYSMHLRHYKTRENLRKLTDVPEQLVWIDGGTTVQQQFSQLRMPNVIMANSRCETTRGMATVAATGYADEEFGVRPQADCKAPVKKAAGAAAAACPPAKMPSPYQQEAVFEQHSSKEVQTSANCGGDATAVKRDQQCQTSCASSCAPPPEDACCPKIKTITVKEDKCTPKVTVWQQIVNYFRARPCPTPEELRQMRLRDHAMKAAQRAGLCVYDPKELAKKKDLPRVIRADKCGEKNL